MNMPIGSIDNFWKLSWLKLDDGKIAEDESKEAVELYDIDGDKTVEVWEYLSKADEQKRAEVIDLKEIAAWKKAYSYQQAFTAAFAKIDFKLSSKIILSILKNVVMELSAGEPDGNGNALLNADKILMRIKTLIEEDLVDRNGIFALYEKSEQGKAVGYQAEALLLIGQAYSSEWQGRDLDRAFGYFKKALRPYYSTFATLEEQSKFDRYKKVEHEDVDLALTQFLNEGDKYMMAALLLRMAEVYKIKYEQRNKDKDRAEAEYLFYCSWQTTDSMLLKKNRLPLAFGFALRSGDVYAAAGQPYQAALRFKKAKDIMDTIHECYDADKAALRQKKISEAKPSLDIKNDDQSKIAYENLDRFMIVFRRTKLVDSVSVVYDFLKRIAVQFGDRTDEAYSVLERIGGETIEKLGMSNIEVLAQRISGNDGVKAIYLLGRMEQEGLVKKNGIDKVMAFFTDVYKTAGDRGNAQLIYIVAATLIDYGVFSDYGMDEVKSKLTKFSSELGPRGFMLLVFIDKLIKDGTVKKLGLEKTCSFVIDCFRSAKYGETKQANLDAIIDGLAFGLGQLAEKGLILKLGVDELLKVSRAAGKGTEAAFVGLYNLEDAGTLKKFGIENLLEIANAAKQKSGEAYDALIALDNKGLIEKIGVSNLVQIAKEAGENSAAKLKELIPEEDRKRPDIFPE